MIRMRGPLPPLACAYQEQYCFPNEIEENRCMPLNTSEASDDAQDRAPSEQLLSTIRWLRQTELTGRNPTNAIFTMRNQALKSRSGLFGGSQSGVASRESRISNGKSILSIGLLSGWLIYNKCSLTFQAEICPIILPSSTRPQMSKEHLFVRIRYVCLMCPPVPTAKS